MEDKIVTTATLDDILKITATDIFVKDLNVLIAFRVGCVTVTDLTDALKPGKQCQKWSLFSECHNIPGRVILDNFLDGFPLTGFVENLRNGHYTQAIAEAYGLRFESWAVKSSDTFSPFAKCKPQKLLNRVNGKKLAKAILAGQVKSVVRNGYYTDDYKGDAEANYHIGEQISLEGAARALIEYDNFSVYRFEGSQLFGSWGMYDWWIINLVE